MLIDWDNVIKKGTFICPVCNGSHIDGQPDSTIDGKPTGLYAVWCLDCRGFHGTFSPERINDFIEGVKLRKLWKQQTNSNDANDVGRQILEERDTYRQTYGDIQKMFLDRFGVLVAYHLRWMGQLKSGGHCPGETLTEILEWCLEHRKDYQPE